MNILKYQIIKKRSMSKQHCFFFNFAKIFKTTKILKSTKNKNRPKTFNLHKKK